MIKSSKQLGVAKNKLKELLASKKEYLEANQINLESFKSRLEINSMNKLISDFEVDITEFESLTKKTNHTLKTQNIEDLPELLIKSRIAKKMTQKDLAKLLHIDEQQIQRYEATNYESASWVRIVDVILAMNLDIKLNDLIISNFNNQQLQITDKEKKAKESIYKNGLFPMNSN